jgi:methanogenic corrinoid protein MtbC1
MAENRPKSRSTYVRAIEKKLSAVEMLKSQEMIGNRKIGRDAARQEAAKMEMKISNNKNKTKLKYCKPYRKWKKSSSYPYRKILTRLEAQFF